MKIGLYFEVTPHSFKDMTSALVRQEGSNALPISLVWDRRAKARTRLWFHWSWLVVDPQMQCSESGPQASRSLPRIFWAGWIWDDIGSDISIYLQIPDWNNIFMASVNLVCPFSIIRELDPRCGWKEKKQSMLVINTFCTAVYFL